ncbi:hypothetical protein T08_1413 [Trichinella sp. T8]|nr:hypothetical protein T08_1413 [Trichinella sp. T8]
MEFVKNRCLRCWYCWREKVGCLQSLEERHFEIFRLFVTFGSLICCCQLWHKFFIFPFVEENLPLVWLFVDANFNSVEEMNRKKYRNIDEKER